MNRAAHTFARLARSPLAPVAPALLSLLVSLSLTAYLGLPLPETHDERSYLLAADTFSNGRLTNPPHPMWRHFQTFHVLVQPTYQSKYPPGQGLILAFGQLTTGLPIAGAWLSSALAAAAAAWALRQWLPPRWALIGGLLAALHPLLAYWSQNYWGGSLAAAAGALLLGAIGSLRRRPSPFGGIALAAAIATFVLTRPYEGLLLTALLFPLLPIRRLLSSAPTLAAAAIVLLPAATFLGYYNYRVTGHPLLLPYVLYERQYSEAPSFVFMTERPPKIYPDPFFQAVYHDSELLHVYRPQRTLSGFLSFATLKLQRFFIAFLLPSIPTLGLLGLLFALLRSRRRASILYLTCATAAFVAAMLLTNWLFPHYAAPIFTPLLLLGLLGLRRLLPNRRARRIVLLLLVPVAVLILCRWATARTADPGQIWARNHDAIAAAIRAQPGGPHLVIVRYQSIPHLNHDWVANAADIDRSPVVWARDLGAADNRELLAYFHDRKPWLMTVNGDDVSVVPYPGPATAP